MKDRGLIELNLHVKLNVVIVLADFNCCCVCEYDRMRDEVLSAVTPDWDGPREEEGENIVAFIREGCRGFR